MFFNRKKNKRTLSETIRNSGAETTGKQIKLACSLSVPAIMAQLSFIIMEYIDTAMVGSLGANASASIGLIATSTWLFMGIGSAFSSGFSVQVAHLLGAGKADEARSVLRQALTATVICGLTLLFIGAAISQPLPQWLGGTPEINGGASVYFFIFALSLPIIQLNTLAAGMLRCSGNMVVPGIVGVVMCLLDITFNFFLIFPSRDVSLLGMHFTMPRAGFGVWGAALGTGLAELVCAVIMLRSLLVHSKELSLRKRPGSFHVRMETFRRAMKIATPMGLERFINSAAQITITVIVAPLGACAIAANAFAVTAESLCYMPGYGISDAATTLVGQTLGAGRRDLANRFAHMTIGLGIAVMTIMGIIMYITAPILIGLMTPVPEILSEGVMALRIEAWAEPMFAASIVAYGAFVGAGDTVIPCIMNLGSMWVIRITLAALLAPIMGLKGVWLAMCIELCCRGLMFLWRLRTGKWMNKAAQLQSQSLPE